MRTRITTVLTAAFLLVSATALAGRLDVHLERAADHATPASMEKLERTGLVSLFTRTVDGADEVFASVILEAKPQAIGALRAQGVVVRSVLSSGIMTADIPVKKLRAVAAIADVGRIEAAGRVKMLNDVSNGLYDDGAGTTWGMNNSGAYDGAGVIVGVIDSGLDWTHGDFIDDATGLSRILSYWDQSDVDDDRVPAGFTYGHEYTQADFDFAVTAFATDWTDGFWDPVDDLTYPIKPSARDTNGHGTHVTGTAAGDGSASGMKGAASGAEIIFVKFDFDGDRNSDAAIIDGVNYIFQKARAAGKPAVINMSLGSDFGPHDGSTLEERGISELTGAGNVVVVAAGNPGSMNWSEALAWGFAMHGSGAMDTDPITFRFPNYDPSYGTYAFFDVWYEGTTECRVRITTPSGAQYPPSFDGRYRKTWTTGSAYTGYDTPEGAVLVANGGDQLSWGTDNGDHEIYIEISDYYGTPPAQGEWTIEIVRTAGADATYHSWHGVSSNLVWAWRDEPTPRDPTPKFGGRESDNAYTIGSPASADDVIAVAAYQSRNTWEYVYGAGCSTTPATQSYGVYPIDYYDPFALGELAYFSGRGPRRDGVLKPEIAAPGVGIASALSHFVLDVEWPDRCVDYGAGGRYHFGTNRVLPNLEATVIQGTSMACPNATGAIALLLQADGTLDDDALRALFATTARHDAATDAGEYVPYTAKTDTDLAAGPGLANNDWGHGKLDVGLSLTELVGALCTSDAECDDGNACTIDTCDAAGACAHAAVADGTACDGGLGLCCAGTCAAPACETGACDDGNECTTDVCLDAGTCAARCEFTAVADDTTCNGGVDICCGGACTAPFCELDADCDDGETCTADTCLNAGTCAAACDSVWPACGPADGCCADGCDATTDPDCASATCGDGVCAGIAFGEDCTTCPADCRCTGRDCSKSCCGDGVCFGENANTCPVDCL